MPSLGPAEPLLTLPVFLLEHGRFPRAPSDPRAGLTDYFFDRKHRLVDEFTRRCCDKIDAKEMAQRLCPDVQVPRTRGVIPLSDISSGEALCHALSCYAGEPVVIKPAHASGGIIFGSQLSTTDFGRYLAAVRGSFFRVARERQYVGLTPRLVVEDLLPGASGQAPPDFKFFCAAGHPFLCQVDTSRFEDHRRDLFLLPGFVQAEADLTYPRSELAIPPPASLSRMLQVARQLSEPFEFVRIDLYDTAQGIFFGEFTFTPDAGTRAFSDEAFNRRLLEEVLLRAHHEPIVAGTAAAAAPGDQRCQDSLPRLFDV